MKRKMLVGALLIILSLGTSAPAMHVAAEDENYPEAYRIELNGSEMELEAAARLVGDTTMVPLRSIAEALGAAVDWRDKTQTAVAAKDGMQIELSVGSTTGYRNGEPVELAAAPLLIDNKAMVPLRFFSESFGTVVKWNGPDKTIAIDSEDRVLPVIGTEAKLRELLSSQYAGNPYDSDTLMRVTGVNETSSIAVPPPAEGASNTKAKAEHSTTNVQVEGVDEADIVKTDGDYLYQVNGNRIIIADTRSANDLKIAGVVSFESQDFHPNELYVDGDTLVVIGSVNNNSVQKMKAVQDSIAMLPIPSAQTAKAIVFDISNKTDIRKTREMELEGSYITSRKIGSSLYMIANRHMGYPPVDYPPQEGDQAVEQLTPKYRDSAVSEEFAVIGVDKIRYLPDSVYTSYMIIAGVRLDRPDSKLNVTAYLGAGSNVYASQSNLYVTQQKTSFTPASVQAQPDAAPAGNNAGAPAVSIVEEKAGTVTIAPSEPGVPVPVLISPPIASKKMASASEKTSAVYKFVLDQGEVRIAASGEVPGHALNQFSMDEYGGYFRIATTTGDMWRNDEQTSKNNVYVLDESLNIAGKLEGIAPGERIYSVRFMGGRAYMVTFKNVDPLFVIDLSNPQSPEVLGSLKIPGYSDYLHPYDDTHLIGFGKDTVELSDPNGNGSSAFYQGMKIAMFDVSDVSRPIELFKENIGDRGTDSELLRNHKALLFSKENNLMAFPVTVMEVPDKSASNSNVPAYGQFAFQGAYVYHVDLADGFRLKSKITHLSDADKLKAGGGWYDSSQNVDRIVTIGSSLYTLSQSEIRAYDLESLNESGRLLIP